jgi:hypothetical protein
LIWRFGARRALRDAGLCSVTPAGSNGMRPQEIECLPVHKMKSHRHKRLPASKLDEFFGEHSISPNGAIVCDCGAVNTEDSLPHGLACFSRLPVCHQL